MIPLVTELMRILTKQEDLLGGRVLTDLFGNAVDVARETVKRFIQETEVGKIDIMVGWQIFLHKEDVVPICPC